jgi:pimeloyl-ACP methyl ester carboxylesterase
MSSVRTVFIHGVGRSGEAAWPTQAAHSCDDWLFLDRESEGDDPERDARRLSELISEEPVILAAHSYGAIAALLLTQRSPELVRALILFEPACLDLARGVSEVEDEIARMSPVMAAARDPSVSDLAYSSLFAEASGLPAPEIPAEVLEAEAARLRALAPPWDTQLDRTAGVPVPTVVVTSGASALYEAVATALVERGAQHLIVSGSGHRPQDVTDVRALIDLVLR